MLRLSYYFILAFSDGTCSQPSIVDRSHPVSPAGHQAHLRSESEGRLVALYTIRAHSETVNCLWNV